MIGEAVIAIDVRPDRVRLRLLDGGCIVYKGWSVTDALADAKRRGFDVTQVE